MLIDEFTIYNIYIDHKQYTFSIVLLPSSSSGQSVLVVLVVSVTVEVVNVTDEEVLVVRVTLEEVPDETSTRRSQ